LNENGDNGGDGTFVDDDEFGSDIDSEGMKN